MNAEHIHAQEKDYFEIVVEETKSRRFGAIILWILIVISAVGAFFITRNLNSENNFAAAGANVSHEVYLYKDRAEPASVTIDRGDEIVFIVKDESRHNMAEERSKKTDARLESGEFGEGETYSLVFESAGTFSLYDRQNGEIHVTIEIRK